MKVIIFEDELPAQEKLLGKIKEHLPTAKVVGIARTVMDAKALLVQHPNIDLIFSDIELLDGITFEIFENTKLICPIIFCTAFDQYLLKAFQSNGIAYLLKPYDNEAFVEAIEKYETMFAASKEPALSPDLLLEFKALVSAKQQKYSTRFIVKKKEGIKLLNVTDIVSFEASGDFSFAYDNLSKKHIINSSIGEIESKLNPTSFFRINRSEIVNIDYITQIESHFKNRLIIKLKHREETLNTSSSKTPEFRVWLEQ